MKPDPYCFNLALSKIDEKSKDVIHIGDTFSTDVVGALSLGINTVWIDGKKSPIKICDISQIENVISQY